MNKFEKMYNPCGLRLPKRLPLKNRVLFAAKLEHPEEMFFDGYLTRIEDQGDKPYCAAYSATSFAENVLWRKRGYIEQIDPVPVYVAAKRLDGDPTGDGTTLEAVLSALIDDGHFDGKVCRVKTFGGAWFGLDPDAAMRDLKMTLHRYGGCIIGCNIDTSWYSPQNGVIKGGGASLGGHAVQCCGADRGGILIANSWSDRWGRGGKAYIPNAVFRKQFIYGATITHCLDCME